MAKEIKNSPKKTQAIFEQMAKAMVTPKPKAKDKKPSDFNEWIAAIKQLDTTKKLIKLEREFRKDLEVVPFDKIATVLNAFDNKADELEHYGK